MPEAGGVPLMTRRSIARSGVRAARNLDAEGGQRRSCDAIRDRDHNATMRADIPGGWCSPETTGQRVEFGPSRLTDHREDERLAVRIDDLRNEFIGVARDDARGRCATDRRCGVGGGREALHVEVERWQLAEALAIGDADQDAPVNGLGRARRRPLESAGARAEGRPVGPIVDAKRQCVPVGVRGRGCELVRLAD